MEHSKQTEIDMKRKNKEIRQISIAGITIMALFLTVSSVYADNEFRGFNIRQEVSKEKGVMVVKPLAEDKQIVDFIYENKIQSLEDYAQWVQKNISYKKEFGTDIWQDPINFLSKRKGDCEDYALLNMEVLKVVGYQPQFIALMGQKKSHAICVFELNGEYYYFDNAVLKKTNTNNIMQFVKDFISQSSYSEVREYLPETKKWNTLYVKA